MSFHMSEVVNSYLEEIDYKFEASDYRTLKPELKKKFLKQCNRELKAISTLKYIFPKICEELHDKCN